MVMSLAPVPSGQPGSPPSCANCSAPLVADQRYCLACGHPVSPARLAFLDVLQAEAQPYTGMAQGTATAYPGGVIGALPPGYTSVVEPASGPYAWLRRYSGLFGLLSVLLLAILAGLLVGHWVTQSKAPSQQVFKVEGLTGAAAAPLASSAVSPTATGPTTDTIATPKPAASGPATAKETAKTEAHEAQEAKAIEKAPAPKAVQVTPTKLQKLGHTTGKKHEEEVNKLGAQPIETGG
jgi:hypothetical protein